MKQHPRALDRLLNARKKQKEPGWEAIEVARNGEGAAKGDFDVPLVEGHYDSVRCTWPLADPNLNS